MSLIKEKGIYAAATCWLPVLIMSLGIVSLGGCKGYDVLRSTAIRSPDGQWVAETVTKQYGGFGSSGVQSEVDLRHDVGPKEKMPILQLSQDEADVHLTLQWVSNSELHISYRGRAAIDFQAVKCGGVSITVAPNGRNGD